MLPRMFLSSAKMMRDLCSLHILPLERFLVRTKLGSCPLTFSRGYVPIDLVNFFIEHPTKPCQGLISDLRMKAEIV